MSYRQQEEERMIYEGLVRCEVAPDVQRFVIAAILHIQQDCKKDYHVADVLSCEDAGPWADRGARSGEGGTKFKLVVKYGDECAMKTVTVGPHTTNPCGYSVTVESTDEVIQAPGGNTEWKMPCAR